MKEEGEKEVDSEKIVPERRVSIFEKGDNMVVGISMPINGLYIYNDREH